MPENLTRREFMKDLGLLGATASLAPRIVFGEEESDKATGLSRPGFIKTVDQPTIEIDWEQVQRYNETNTCRRGFVKYVGEDRMAKLNDLRAANLDRFLKDNKPGYTLKDVALQSGVGAGDQPRSFIGPQSANTPEDLGVPKWTGSPEEASMLVRAAMRHFGAATVGFVELDTNTTEKLIYSHDPDGKEMKILDVDEPAEDDESRTIPKKARWVVVYTVQMSEETLARAPTILGSLTTSLTYTRAQNIQARLQEFLRGLGYLGVGESSTNALGIAPALAVMAGLGEMSRYNRLLTPEYGPMVRVFKLATDLPLAPTKPINAGLFQFCHSCTKCADHCPSKALSFDPEPSWEVRGGWNNPGHKAFFEDSVKCRSYWSEVGTNCGVCFAVCPFASKNVASYNRLRNYLAATTGVFNKPLKSLDDLLYTPYIEFGKPQKDPELWWTQNLPDYGIDTGQTVRET
jgi:epoxyqueuosine reductase